MVGLDHNTSLIVSMNFTIGASCGYIAYRYLRWVIKDWARLRNLSLGVLPISITMLLGTLGIERPFYGMARMSKELWGWNLWGASTLVLLLGVAILLSSALHMVPIWNTERDVNVPKRIVCTTASILALWAGLYFLLKT